MPANGTLLNEVLEILRDNQTIPETVTNRIILAAQVHVYRKMDDLDKRVICLEEEARKAVTWPYVLRTFVVPSMMALVTLGLAYIFSRMVGASP